HGAWAITAATVAQARVMHRFGVPRVVLANEVVEPAQVEWLGTVSDEPHFEVFCLVDSVAGVEQMERALSGSGHEVEVLVELGVEGRRTGVRDVGEALALAERVVQSPSLRLAGVEGYEGVLPQGRDGTSEATARSWLDRLVDLTVRADAQDLFAAAGRVVVTAGGSGYPDLVAEAFSAVPELSYPSTFVIRSGCYLTHDDVQYERSSPLRSGADPDPLRPALTCFSRVLSAPEAGRVLLGVGKREISFDVELPVVRAVHRGGERIPLDGHARIVELNDHHGFCDVDADLLGVGDLVELGPSHPCTVFDKWPLVPVVDADGAVVDAVRTMF
ncbi:MAG: amino acid deaminase, partial [Nocardioidaceae bacterium]